jgi:hypothetical protein
MYFIWKFVYVYHNLDVEHYAFDITEDWAKKWTRLRKTRNKRLWSKILYEDKYKKKKWDSTDSSVKLLRNNTFFFFSI